ncbi:MAG: TIGR04282 family arsenosugar biosynthesis glycosyltransferase [Bryobacterales bacterium]|nr:TIGR04282 family arsenosugar biosynthesis glycosyltransferase [Bryobacterales bacterium]
MKSRLIVFAKDPRPGNVKTRLVPTLGAVAAADLYRAMVLDLLDMLMRFAAIADIEIHLDAHSDFFQQLPAKTRLQKGEGLGEKLLHAIQAALAEGARFVTVVGSDHPELTAAAVEDLLRPIADIVYGPASDGGFWGITASKGHPAMFRGVEWSSGGTLQDCLSAAAKCGLSVSLGQECADVDEILDLQRLDMLHVGARTAQALRELAPIISGAQNDG